MIQAPCKDCSDREIGCHSSCRLYIDFQSLNRKEHEEAYKQKPLLYTYTNFYNKHLRGKIDAYKLMIAQYSAEEPTLADGRDYLIWQYTSKGRINGINTYVDKSRFMGRHSMREIRFRHR